MNEVAPGWEQWFLLGSDDHWDNPHCDRVMHKRHLDQAVERNAGILRFGDFFCAMQGRYDPRASKESVRPEHQVNNYLDALVNTATDYLMPYRDHIAMIGYGNHETSIMKRQETDLVRRLTTALDVPLGGYSGFVRFMFRQGGSGYISHALYYHHGAGGGGPVTKGTIQSNRRAVYIPDATYVVTGHVHEEWRLTQPRVRLSTSGKVYLDEQMHIQLPTYKQEFDMAGGYHVENQRPPKPLGGAWLHFYYDNHQRGRVGFDVLRAK